MEIAHLNIPLLMTLVMVATAVALAVKWVKLPYAIALVLVGLCIGVFHLLPRVKMTPELIMVIFLPSLLFEASWNLDLRMLKKSARAVASFATVGVFISTGVVALIMHQLGGIDLPTALVFGAMVSATDPISVLALFKRIGVDRNLIILLEGESLLNDGTAVALFRVLLAGALAGGSISWLGVGAEFVLVTIGGTVVGTLIGFIACRLTRFFDDHLLEITLTAIVAYGSYLVAEQFKVSSVIAVLVAGVVMGNYGSRSSMSPTTRLAVNAFWEYAAFITESLVFLLIGMQIQLELLIKYSNFIGLGILGILVGRFCLVYGLAPLVSTRRRPISLRWCHLLFWGGLRGSLCMAMALSLPAGFPMREPIVVTAYGVALFTLLVPGLTMEALVDWLKVGSTHVARTAKYQKLKSSLKKQELALEKLKTSYKTGKITKQEYNHSRLRIEESKEETEFLILRLEQEGSIDEVERIQIERALLDAQRECLQDLQRKGTVGQSAIESYKLKVDEELDTLKSSLHSGDSDEDSGEQPEIAGK